MSKTHRDSTIKVLITIKSGIVEEIAATKRIDVTIYDKDTQAIGEDALSPSFDQVYVISNTMMKARIRELT
jgi:hypothetical protein